MLEFVNELTARLENKPGRLAKVCDALAREKINIRALSVMDSGERSVLRVVVDQLEPAQKVFTTLGVESTPREVLALDMDNRPGSLTRVLERLAGEHINIEYAYVSGASAPGQALGIFHTDNPKKALQVLAETFTPSDSDRDSGRRPLHSR